jgi:hypothetical protein
MKYLQILYSHARPYFLSFIPMIKDHGLTVHHSSISHGYSGPHHEKITTDYLRIGTSRSHWILVSSGVHGVELFAGSAIQCRILEEIANQNLFIPEGVGVLFVHSVDPFGAAFLRHTNINNVDLNRNFLQDRGRIDHVTNNPDYLKAMQVYKENEDFINPKGFSKYDYPKLKAAQLALKYGKDEFLYDLTVGQRHNSKGLFYCGTSLEQELSSLLNNVQTLLGTNITLFHIDIQSGFGQPGDYTLFCTLNKDKQLLHKLGESKKLYSKIEEDSYKTASTGFVVDGLGESLGAGDHAGIVMNFGTVNRYMSLLAVRNENIWHNINENISAYSYGRNVEVNIEEYLNHESKKELFGSFCLEDQRWEKEITERGLAFFKKALAYQADKALSNK